MKKNTFDMSALLAIEEEKEQKRLYNVVKLIQKGVIFVDYKSAYIGDEVCIGKGTVVEPGVMIEGSTAIGENCIIGYNTKIVDSIIADEVKVQCSVILKSKIGKGTSIGPFAYLRPDNVIGENVKIGDFVEVKNSEIGDGAKASHLTYIGDADVGPGVNLGCGVVFVNYNGSEKHRSKVSENAFIGCNSNLISPVNIGEKAYVAAGTTITKDVPAGSLCIGRAKDQIVPGWVEKRGILNKKK